MSKLQGMMDMSWWHIFQTQKIHHRTPKIEMMTNEQTGSWGVRAFGKKNKHSVYVNVGRRDNHRIFNVKFSLRIYLWLYCFVYFEEQTIFFLKIHEMRKIKRRRKGKEKEKWILIQNFFPFMQIGYCCSYSFLSVFDNWQKRYNWNKALFICFQSILKQLMHSCGVTKSCLFLIHSSYFVLS